MDIFSAIVGAAGGSVTTVVSRVVYNWVKKVVVATKAKFVAWRDDVQQGAAQVKAEVKEKVEEIKNKF